MVQKMVLVGGVMFFLFLSGNVIGETSALVNAKSCLLIFGGSLLIAFLAFPMKTLGELLESLRSLFQKTEEDQENIVGKIVSLARVARVHGVRSLEAEGARIGNPFIRKGIELVVDGYDRFEIRNIMEKEYELYFARKDSQVNVLNTLAKIAPVLGFVGTIIGLINVLGNIGEVAEIGKGMALALLTTFYGLLFSNFLFLPIARKFSEQIKSEAALLNVILEGIMDISEQKNSQAISFRLQSYLGFDGSETGERVETPREGDRHILDFPLRQAAAGK